jgi:hypothetical protein
MLQRSAVVLQRALSSVPLRAAAKGPLSVRESVLVQERE